MQAVAATARPGVVLSRPDRAAPYRRDGVTLRHHGGTQVVEVTVPSRCWGEFRWAYGRTTALKLMSWFRWAGIETEWRASGHIHHEVVVVHDSVG